MINAQQKHDSEKLSLPMYKCMHLAVNLYTKCKKKGMHNTLSGLAFIVIKVNKNITAFL